MRMMKLRIIYLLALAFNAFQLPAQIAVEFARAENGPSLLPLIEKGQANTSSPLAGFFTTERFSANPDDYLKPEWLEATLNELYLFSKGESIEVLYLIPEEKGAVLVICKRGVELGYLRVISLLEESS